VRALEEGIAGPVIDQAAKNFGMPMGPIELADAVGLDICLHVADILCADLGGEVPQRLRDMVDEGRLGKKSGEGFYRYHKGKSLVEPIPAHRIPENLTDRLVFSMINEAIQCLHEQVVEDSDAMDTGIVFGTGFAPFLGGPCHYLEDMGLETARSRLKALENQYGDRFTAKEGW
jgi:3-hydroxyacyl-CoA dehydrogenase/enoyl-CoA hydratase/3-hydroxybutyryl-CoA epimerase